MRNELLSKEYKRWVKNKDHDKAVREIMNEQFWQNQEVQWELAALAIMERTQERINTSLTLLHK